MTNHLFDSAGTEVKGNATWLQPYPVELLDIAQFGQPACTTHAAGSSPSASGDVLFSRELDAYFSAKGAKQKQLRTALASSLVRSGDLSDRIGLVLDKIAELHSQALLTAAIDLLSELDVRIVQAAIRMALETRSFNESAALLLAAIDRSPKTHR